MCSFQDHVIDNCARSRYLAMTMEYFFMGSGVNLHEKRRCPMLRCPEYPQNARELIRHLKVCPCFPEGEMRCPDCHNTKCFSAVNKSQCSWKREHFSAKVSAKVGNVIKGVTRSFSGKRSSSPLIQNTIIPNWTPANYGGDFVPMPPRYHSQEQMEAGSSCGFNELPGRRSSSPSNQNTKSTWTPASHGGNFGLGRDIGARPEPHRYCGQEQTDTGSSCGFNELSEDSAISELQPRSAQTAAAQLPEAVEYHLQQSKHYPDIKKAMHSTSEVDISSEPGPFSSDKVPVQEGYTPVTGSVGCAIWNEGHPALRPSNTAFQPSTHFPWRGQQSTVQPPISADSIVSPMSSISDSFEGDVISELDSTAPAAHFASMLTASPTLMGASLESDHLLAIPDIPELDADIDNTPRNVSESSQEGIDFSEFMGSLQDPCHNPSGHAAPPLPSAAFLSLEKSLSPMFMSGNSALNAASNLQFSATTRSSMTPSRQTSTDSQETLVGSLAKMESPRDSERMKWMMGAGVFSKPVLQPGNNIAELAGSTPLDDVSKPDLNCPHCSRLFPYPQDGHVDRQKNNLSRHIQRNHRHNKEGFKCDQCGQVLSREDNLTRHYKLQHPERPEVVRRRATTRRRPRSDARRERVLHPAIIV